MFRGLKCLHLQGPRVLNLKALWSFETSINIYNPRLPETTEDLILQALSSSGYRSHCFHKNHTMENNMDDVLFRGLDTTIGLKLSEGNEVDV
jgi:hypothetical protein